MTNEQGYEGYYIAYNSIDGDSNLTVCSKRLLCRYINYTKNKVEITFKNELMAQWLGVGLNTIKRSIEQLEELGYIKVKHNISNDGKYKANTIQVDKVKVNTDFGWHIFKDISPTNESVEAQKNSGNALIKPTKKRIIPNEDGPEAFLKRLRNNVYNNGDECKEN